MAAAARTFTDRCIAGIEADEARATELVERNIIIVTALAPHVGYDEAAAVAKEAFASNRGVRDVVLERQLMEADRLDEVLDLARMTEGGILS